MKEDEKKIVVSLPLNSSCYHKDDETLSFELMERKLRLYSTTVKQLQVYSEITSYSLLESVYSVSAMYTFI